MQVQTNTGNDTVPLNLALQGGGTYGAFTWGVLDRLLEEPAFTLNAVSGTSAGAMNGAALISGLAKGGRDDARETLENFWRSVSDEARLATYNVATAKLMFGGLGLNPAMLKPMIGAGMQLFSPYDLNPSGSNPLRDILEETVDMQAVAESGIGFYVTATHVGTGEARIFENSEVTTDVLLASACLPALFHAIEIDGEFYWDGGYTGNPSLMPLVENRAARDLLLIQTSRTGQNDLPRDAQEIAAREREISFSAPLVKELRALAELQSQARENGGSALWRLVSGRGRRQGDSVDARTLSRLRMHRIPFPGDNGDGGDDKLTPSWSWLTRLRDTGRQAGERFLATHRRDLGHRSSFDLGQYLHRHGAAPRQVAPLVTDAAKEA